MKANGKTAGISEPETMTAVLPPHAIATITIPELKIGLLTLTIDSVSPLLVHNFGEKIKRQIRDKQEGKPRQKKEAKNPTEEFLGSLYPMDAKNPLKAEVVNGITICRGRFGFPASGLKKAAVSACRYVDDINMTFCKGAFHVVGDLLEIESVGPPEMHKQKANGSTSTSEMREDAVRLNSGPRPVADIRFRGIFNKWKMKIPVRYNASVVTPAVLVNLFNVAGFAVGIGEWRPERSGSFGMFEVSKNSMAEVSN